MRYHHFLFNGKTYICITSLPMKKTLKEKKYKREAGEKSNALNKWMKQKKYKEHVSYKIDGKNNWSMELCLIVFYFGGFFLSGRYGFSWLLACLLIFLMHKVQLDQNWTIFSNKKIIMIYLRLWHRWRVLWCKWEIPIMHLMMQMKSLWSNDAN